MSENILDEQFWNLADSFIRVANDHSRATGSGKVSAAMSYAAARFNAFVLASSKASAAELQADEEKAIDYFTEQYRRMLKDNLADYAKNYSRYLKK